MKPFKSMGNQRSEIARTAIDVGLTASDTARRIRDEFSRVVSRIAAGESLTVADANEMIKVLDAVAKEIEAQDAQLRQLRSRL